MTSNAESNISYSDAPVLKASYGKILLSREEYYSLKPAEYDEETFEDEEDKKSKEPEMDMESPLMENRADISTCDAADAERVLSGPYHYAYLYSPLYSRWSPLSNWA